MELFAGADVSVPKTRAGDRTCARDLEQGELRKMAAPLPALPPPCPQELPKNKRQFKSRNITSVAVAPNY